MNCPVCHNVRMREVDKDGVVIDICPDCKGVWLDRGELEKLMSGVKEIRDDFNDWHRERERERERDYDRDRDRDYDRDRERYGDGDRGRYSDDRRSPHYGKRKKNFLDVIGDIFD